MATSNDSAVAAQNASPKKVVAGLAAKYPALQPGCKRISHGDDLSHSMNGQAVDVLGVVMAAGQVVASRHKAHPIYQNAVFGVLDVTSPEHPVFTSTVQLHCKGAAVDLLMPFYNNLHVARIEDLPVLHLTLKASAGADQPSWSIFKPDLANRVRTSCAEMICIQSPADVSLAETAMATNNGDYTALAESVVHLDELKDHVKLGHSFMSEGMLAVPPSSVESCTPHQKQPLNCLYIDCSSHSEASTKIWQPKLCDPACLNTLRTFWNIVATREGTPDQINDGNFQDDLQIGLATVVGPPLHPPLAEDIANWLEQCQSMRAEVCLAASFADQQVHSVKHLAAEATRTKAVPGWIKGKLSMNLYGSTIMQYTRKDKATKFIMVKRRFVDAHTGETYYISLFGPAAVAVLNLAPNADLTPFLKSHARRAAAMAEYEERMESKNVVLRVRITRAANNKDGEEDYVNISASFLIDEDNLSLAESAADDSEPNQSAVESMDDDCDTEGDDDVDHLPAPAPSRSPKRRPGRRAVARHTKPKRAVSPVNFRIRRFHEQLQPK